MDRVIGENVSFLMRTRDVTARELAADIGMSESGLIPRLRGERGWRPQHLVNVAARFGVTVVDLYGADATDALPTHGRPFCVARPGGDLACRDCARARLAYALRQADLHTEQATSVDANDAAGANERNGLRSRCQR